MILLGKNPGIVQMHTNNQSCSEADTEYLLINALKKAYIKNIPFDQPINDDLADHVNDESICSSSSSMSSARTQQDIIEKNGLTYIAGSLAKQKLKTYSNLGRYTKQNEVNQMHSYAIPSWIQNLSFGGLIEPSEEWNTQVKRMERYFVNYHNDTFGFRKGVLKNTIHFVGENVSDRDEYTRRTNLLFL